MRGTTKISNSTSLQYLTKNWNALEKVQQQISKQMKVPMLEDNPLAANIGIRLLTTQNRTEQYIRNIETGLGFLGLTDQSLRSSKTIMDKIKTLVIGASQDTTTAEQRQANASELNAILQNLIAASNKYNGERYLFGGQYTKSPPFEIVNGRYVNYLGDDKKIDIRTDHGITQSINATGTDAYGSMDTVIGSRDYSPDVCLATDRSTSLADLNNGKGVPKGKITVYYSSYPDGLEVDLSGCDTLEDVKDAIEKQTLGASRKLDPSQHSWLDYSNLNWRDMQDRYVKVTVNPDHNGISLQEFDLGEPLPEPTVYEARKGIGYDDFGGAAPGYAAGGYGVAGTARPAGEVTVYDADDFVHHSGNQTYAPLRVDDVAYNKVADALGIKGTANVYDPAHPDRVMDGFIHGKDLSPKLSDKTLLADLDGYNDATYTFYNGSIPGAITIKETSQDNNHVFNNWNLKGLSKGKNTGPNGELYAKVSRRGPPDNDIFVELYTKPVDKAKAGDLVATGSYTQSAAGGTVILSEANSSGLSGTVGIVLPQNSNGATVNLGVDFGDRIQSSVHVPAFVEESDEHGLSKDIFNIASGWQIRGLDKPPAVGYDVNHPISTDLKGDVGVNYRYVDEGNGQTYFMVELYRPSFNDVPAQKIATGKLPLFQSEWDAVNNAWVNTPIDLTSENVSGRVEFVGEPGFESIAGSVYIELPAGTTFSNEAVGAGVDDATNVTFQLTEDGPAGEMHLGGAMELIKDMALAPAAGDTTGKFVLTGDTVFKAGQTFSKAIQLPNGGVIPAGVPLAEDMKIPKGVIIYADQIQSGTVLPEGLNIDFGEPVPAGTVIPRGSYYTDPGNSFPADGMSMSVTTTSATTGETTTTSAHPIGYNVNATFATIEDFDRAVEESGVYVKSRVGADGKSLEFVSTLAGAYLTVSEDTDCYEQMNDVYNQLAGLNLDGLVKDINTDSYGNVYTEVVYYPPNPTDDPTKPPTKVKLVSDSGEIVEVDPGYYVRIYSDKDALDSSYENRDNSKMIAEGFLAAPRWQDPIADQANPFVASNPPPFTIGVMQNMVLEERNDSGVSGTVNLDYYGGRDQGTQVTNDQGNVSFDYNYLHNDEITVFPGGLRPAGSAHTTIQQWNMVNIEPGVTCDYSGTFHGKVSRDSTLPPTYQTDIQVALYKDASNTSMTSRNDPENDGIGPDGKVQLYETFSDGRFKLDKDGNKIPAGFVVMDASNLPDGKSDTFELSTGASRQSGRERTENLFSTINDILDALNSNDAEALHNLTGSIEKDIDRILAADGDISAITAQMNLLIERQKDAVTYYKTTVSSTIGMDTVALSQALLDKMACENAYNAAMQVAGTMLQMSLLDYLR